MIIRMNLYYIHDYDLIVVHNNYRFSIIVEEAIKSMINRDRRVFEIPNDATLPEIKTYKQCVKITINDPDVINYLDHVKPKMRTAAIKSALKSYISNTFWIYTHDYELPTPTEESFKESTDNVRTEIHSKGETSKRITPFIREGTSFDSAKVDMGAKEEKTVFDLAMENMM